MNTIGSRVKLLRQQSGISMADLAKKIEIEISPSTISNIENGKHSPNSDIVIALSKFFNVSTDYLLLGKEGCDKKTNSTDSNDDDIQFSKDEIGTLKSLISFIDKKNKQE